MSTRLERAERQAAKGKLSPTRHREIVIAERNKEILALQQHKRETDQLLRDLGTALEDWLHTFAPELCGEPYVSESHQRIYDGGGTLAYIADLRQRVDDALGIKRKTWGEIQEELSAAKEPK